MPALATIGYALIAYSPITALFFGTVASYPHEVILLILGSFFYLVAFLLTAIIWVIIPPLWRNPVIAVIFGAPLQEFFRFLYYRTLKRVDHLLQVVSGDSTYKRKHKQAYVGGMGFGIMAGALSGINMIILSASSGTAGLAINEQSPISDSFFITTTFMVLIQIFLHICWGVLYFDAIEKRQYWKVVIVILTHLAASLVTLVNLYIPGQSAAPYVVIANAVLLLVLMGFTFWTAGLSISGIRYLFRIR